MLDIDDIPKWASFITLDPIMSCFTSRFPKVDKPEQSPVRGSYIVWNRLRQLVDESKSKVYMCKYPTNPKYEKVIFWPQQVCKKR